jgi:tRNA(Ile)-lysidine synthase
MTRQTAHALASPASFERRVVAFVRQAEVLRPGEEALLLLSGGADSMALLALLPLVSWRAGLRLRLRALHVDYATRGADSERDRHIVEQACEDARVPLDVVRLECRLTGADFQRRARELRYRAARDVCDREALDVIVTAHNRDDQAETVLYRLVKYAAPSSLVGMRPREGDLARPLLCVSAAEIREYCAATDTAYGDDVSNATTVYARNLLRHEVLPVLERINPAVAVTLADGAEIAAAERAVLAGALEEAWGRAAGRVGGEVLDVAALAQEPPALRALCLRRLLQGVYGEEALLERRLLAALLDLAGTSGGTRRVSLPGGFEAVREYGRLRVEPRRAPHVCEPVLLRVGSTAMFCGRRFAAATVAEAPAPERLTGDGAEAFLALDHPVASLVLRHPRRGDAFQPFGMSARVSLARFLAAAKVPAGARERTVVAELGGALAWISPPAPAGSRVAEHYRVGTRPRLVLRLAEEAR